MPIISKSRALPLKALNSLRRMATFEIAWPLLE
jgi:hypothetical protein